MTDLSYRWYVVHVYSGNEKRVAQYIKEQSAKKGIADCFLEVLVPSEEVVEIKKGVKTNTEKKIFPGYILINMHLNDESWHLVKNTPKVTGFLGSKTKPVPISQAEAEKLFNQLQEGAKVAKTTLKFESGEVVKVSDGPFASFTGTVEEVDDEKSRLKVSVTIFGRATPVDLEFTQVEKL